MSGSVVFDYVMLSAKKALHSIRPAVFDVASGVLRQSEITLTKELLPAAFAGRESIKGSTVVVRVVFDAGQEVVGWDIDEKTSDTERPDIRSSPDVLHAFISQLVIVNKAGDVRVRDPMRPRRLASGADSASLMQALSD